MLRTPVAAALLLVAISATTTSAESELKTRWKELTTEKDGLWGLGANDAHPGQVCDGGADGTGADLGKGCVTIFIADPDDEWDLGKVNAGEQNKFQNTLAYEAAYTLDGEGFYGNSLARTKDIAPACVIANVTGKLVLGYEEGSGELTPCPGHNTGVPFTEAMIKAGMEGRRDLEDMCSQCYWSVCTGSRSTNPRWCGSGIDLETEATFYEQATPVYHCHVTMAEDGACDFMQYDQLQAGKGYNMDYSVMCGWEAVQDLKVTYCDCTERKGRADGCGRREATEMALRGVVCGNCWNGFSQSRAYDSIFKTPNEDDEFDGTCALASTATTEAGRGHNAMMCSKSLWCPRSYDGGSKCKFHCSRHGKYAPVEYQDPDCLGRYPNFDLEKSTDAGKYFYMPLLETRSFTDAEQRCVELGGHLASIANEEEHDIVINLAKKQGVRYAWIGYSDKATEGTWVWSDGSTGTFSKWMSRQPDDTVGDENCAELRVSGWGAEQWNDKECEVDYNFVCSGTSSFLPEDARRRLLAADELPAASEDMSDDEDEPDSQQLDWDHVVTQVRASGVLEQHKSEQ